MGTDKPPIPDTTTLVAPIKASRNDLNEYLRSVFATYGIESQIKMAEAVVSCESSWNVLAYNKDDERFVKGGSYGIAQFTRPTFFENCTGDYENPYDQISCMAKLWKRGEQHRWTCYKNLY